MPAGFLAVFERPRPLDLCLCSLRLRLRMHASRDSEAFVPFAKTHFCNGNTHNYQLDPIKQPCLQIKGTNRIAAVGRKTHMRHEYEPGVPTCATSMNLVYPRVLLV
jgi:hypothetical protein